MSRPEDQFTKDMMPYGFGDSTIIAKGEAPDAVKAKLKKDGSVTRSWALKNGVLYLSSVIYNLRLQGWQIKTKKTRGKGSDTWYQLVSAPKK